MAGDERTSERRTVRAGRGGGRYTLSVTLTTGIGLLLVVAVLTVLGIGLWSARRNTLELLGAQAQLAISSSVAKIQDHLEPAVHQTEAIAELIAEGEFEPGAADAFNALLIGALTSAPQIKGLVFIDPAYQLIGARRDVDGQILPYRDDHSADQAVRRAVAAARGSSSPIWGAPVWRDEYGTTFVNLRMPVRRDGSFLGVLVALISIGELSENTAQLSSAQGNTVFVLYGGKDVLAHPMMIDGYPGLSDEVPLPAAAEFSDPVLAAMTRASDRRPLAIALPKGMTGFVIDAFRERYVFILRDVAGFGPKSWQVGAYYRAREVKEFTDRLLWSGAAGLAALVVAFVCALVLARGIARPVRRLAEAAGRIERLEIDGVGELPGSRIRELDDQSGAFNAMLAGLRWFEVYVPKTLVRRLMGQDAAPASEERELTVMFTDIAGFTGVAEGVPAEAVAEFLNEHFAVVARAVEDEDGTVDKFIGDAVMAFWGAPEAQPDHAERAVRAARAIARAVGDDNARRRADGMPPVRMRIGLHSGPAVVGNIGAPGRMNYTIVGDTVNVAQRLEQLGKRVNDGALEIAILISGETASRLAVRDGLAPAGAFEVPGRAEPVEVFRLV